LRKRLRLEELQPRHIALGAGALFLLSVAVTLIVLAASPRRDAPAESQPEAGDAGPAVGGLGIKDFLLETPEPPPQPRVYLFRERMPRWTEEQVQKYWVPVNEAVLRILRRENDRRTEELLREVP
jgi:hypothetical protein